MKKIMGSLLLFFCLTVILTQTVLADEENYTNFFIPEKDGISQPYVGDCMPYYEDGVYYIYYLKEGGDSFRHSIYLATTTDFITYTEYDDPILVSSEEEMQDEWIGTGSVVKVEDTYYLFYTGHTDSGNFEYGETIMLAKGDSLTSFEKVPDWEIIPDASLNQKRDFRDPQGYYDEETGMITFTITASQDGVARILKYTVSKDLSEITYDGIIFTDPIGKVYNLECSDTFRMGDTYYLTYSAQDDTLWYAASEEPYGPYSDPIRMDGPLFYAAKHVESEDGVYMAGWARRSQSESNTTSVSEWAGNLLVQQVKQLEDGSLVLEAVDAIAGQYQNSLDTTSTEISLTAEEEKVYEEIGNIPERFMVKGSFTYEGSGSFGLAFDFKDDESNYKLIAIDPENQKISLQFKGGKRVIAENDLALNVGETYDFTYIQENSVGVFYINDVTALTVRLYRVTEKPVRVYAEQNQVTFSNLEILAE